MEKKHFVQTDIGKYMEYHKSQFFFSKLSTRLLNKDAYKATTSVTKLFLRIITAQSLSDILLRIAKLRLINPNLGKNAKNYIENCFMDAYKVCWNKSFKESYCNLKPKRYWPTNLNPVLAEDVYLFNNLCNQLIKSECYIEDEMMSTTSETTI